MARVIAWLRKWWGAIAAGVALLFGGAFLWSRRKTLTAEAAFEVGKLREEIAVKRAAREVLLEADTTDAEVVEELDLALEENERAILKLHEEEVGDATRDEIRERLRRLGF